MLRFQVGFAQRRVHGVQLAGRKRFAVHQIGVAARELLVAQISRAHQGHDHEQAHGCPRAGGHRLEQLDQLADGLLEIIHPWTLDLTIALNRTREEGRVYVLTKSANP